MPAGRVNPGQQRSGQRWHPHPHPGQRRRHDADQLEHAFEPFFTTRPVGAGAGLGLSTARNIVLAHSGRIELLSEPELGTTVTLFFPRPS
jgi:phosphoglycerate-specific signal transduction histidine kinase